MNPVGIKTNPNHFGRLAMRPLFFPLVLESRANTTPNLILSRSRGGAREQCHEAGAGVLVVVINDEFAVLAAK